VETGQRIRPNAYRTPSGAVGQTDQAEAVRGRSSAYVLSDRDAAGGKGAGGARLPFGLRGSPGGLRRDTEELIRESADGPCLNAWAGGAARSDLTPDGMQPLLNAAAWDA
jgi:hypothetical protein